MSAVFFFHFWSLKDSLQMLDPDPYPDPDSVNPDTQQLVLLLVIFYEESLLVTGFIDIFSMD
jgi:hypothetical protein